MATANMMPKQYMKGQEYEAVARYALLLHDYCIGWIIGIHKNSAMPNNRDHPWKRKKVSK